MTPPDFTTHRTLNPEDENYNKRLLSHCTPSRLHNTPIPATSVNQTKTKCVYLHIIYSTKHFIFSTTNNRLSKKCPILIEKCPFYGHFSVSDYFGLSCFKSILYYFHTALKRQKPCGAEGSSKVRPALRRAFAVYAASLVARVCLLP